MSEIATIQVVQTPDGPFIVIADEQDRVIGSGWTDDPERVVAQIHESIRPSELQQGTTTAGQAVIDYYAGDSQAANNVSTHVVGTDFQRRGWDVLRQIPPGRPLSYSEFAREIGSPGAVRAAGTVCAKNPVALFVPCHRVLRSDGSMGGFGWGTETKQSLLDREADLHH